MRPEYGAGRDALSTAAFLAVPRGAVKTWAEGGPARDVNRSGGVLATHLFDELDDTAAQLRVLNAHKRLDQRQAIGGRQKIRDVSGRRRLFQSLRPAAAGRSRRALKEKRDRHLQDERDLLQPARANPVGALFVFLDLLEREAERVAELLLTHAPHHAAHADAAPDMLVDRVRRLLGHPALLWNLDAPHNLMHAARESNAGIAGKD